MEHKTKRKRISFIANKTKKSLISSNDSSLIDLEKYQKIKNMNKVKLNKIHSKKTQIIKNLYSYEQGNLASEIIKIYDNSKLNEKIFLFKNKIDFSIIGSGSLRIIYGQFNLMGYNISSLYDLEDYDFDMNENFLLYSCHNNGNTIENENEYEGLVKSLKSFTNSNNNNQSIRFLKDHHFNRNMDYITICYFKNLSNNFEVLTFDEINKRNLEIINFSSYPQENISDSKKILICGKKNSGKSTFLIYKINSIMSKINRKIKTQSTLVSHPYLFLLDSDSGQPLLSSPFNVSLVKINRPLLFNFYKEFSSNSLNLSKKSCNNFSSSEIVLSIFVEETEPSCNFDNYLNSVQDLIKLFDKIEYNKLHYLIVNTNGYTSGLGNLINSSIVNLVKPDITYYVKNKKSGRQEKGEEFENYILKEEEKDYMNVILRKTKLDSSVHSNLEIKSILIENEFDLKEDKNYKYKNMNKSLYIYTNLLGKDINQNYKKNSCLFNLNELLNQKGILNSV
jgi:hypothetical protein